MVPVTCYLAEAFYNVAMFNQDDAFVHFRTVQVVLNREGGTVPAPGLGRLRIARTTLGGLNPEQGGIEKTVDRRLDDSDDLESAIVKEIPEFLTLGVAI